MWEMLPGSDIQDINIHNLNNVMYCQNNNNKGAQLPAQ